MAIGEITIRACFFLKQLSRLREADIPVFMIRGNHDAASRITKSLTLPDKVYEFSSKKCETHRIEDLDVAIHGHSFATRAVTDDISRNYPNADAGCLNIGLLHTCATGKDGHENYAPCTVDGLTAKGYDYWALGHVHHREILCEEPWVVFAGNTQGRHAREVGDKGCSLVTVSDARIVNVEHRSLNVVRWFNSPVKWERSLGRDGVLDEVRKSLLKAQKASEGQLAAVRLTITGESDDHLEITRFPENFRSDCQAVANDIGDDLWLEKIKVATRPSIDLDTIRRTDGPVGDLLRFIDSKRGDGAFASQAPTLIDDLWPKLPDTYKNSADALRLNDPEQLRNLLNDVERELVLRLMAREAGE